MRRRDGFLGADVPSDCLPSTCTGASGEGTVTGTKTVGDLVLTLSGCAIDGHTCDTPAASTGLVQTNPLEGEIAWQDKSRGKVALVLHSRAPQEDLYYWCPEPELEGLVLGSLAVPIASDKSTTSTMLKIAAKRGRQQPEALEDGERPVLDLLEYQLSGESSRGQAGVNAKLTATSEERIEISASR